LEKDGIVEVNNNEFYEEMVPIDIHPCGQKHLHWKRFTGNA
jgi:hypothetical protein